MRACAGVPPSSAVVNGLLYGSIRNSVRGRPRRGQGRTQEVRDTKVMQEVGEDNTSTLRRFGSAHRV